MHGYLCRRTALGTSYYAALQVTAIHGAGRRVTDYAKRYLSI